VETPRRLLGRGFAYASSRTEPVGGRTSGGRRGSGPGRAARGWGAAVVFDAVYGRSGKFVRGDKVL
jgi:hypothetical protein